MSNKSKKMTEKAKTWKRFEMEPLEPPFSPKKKRESHFAPFQTGEGENGDFIPLKESGEYHKRRKEAADILREAKEKAALTWRFNNRENPYLFRDTLLRLIGSQSL